MIAFVSTLLRYRKYGWLYKIDLTNERIVGKVKVASDSADAKHGGPHGIAWLGNHLVTGTFSDIRLFDADLNEVHRFSSPRLAGVHGVSVNGSKIWVSSCNNEAVICFDGDGNVLEEFQLRQNRRLLEQCGVESPSHFGDGAAIADYRRQPFHVNHVQEIGGELLVSLHKQGCIWDLRGNRMVCPDMGRGIHDAQKFDGRYFVNDTGNQAFKVYSDDGTLHVAIPTRYYRLRQFIAEMRGRLGLDKERVCRVNWLRGLAFVDDRTVLVGVSPATVLRIDLEKAAVRNDIQLSRENCEAVFGIALA